MARSKNTKRKDGRIAVQVYIGRDENGKRKYKTVYGRTQKEADDKAIELKVSLKKGIDITAKYDTFGKWADAWLNLKSSEVSNGRITVLKSCIKHLSPISEVPITKIKTADIQKIILNLSIENPNTTRPASAELLNDIKQTANQVFQLAINNRVMDYNPVYAVKIPKKEEQKRIQTLSNEDKKARSLTSEEQLWITHFPHRCQTAAMIMMYAGLRKGELIPLTWSDIDLTHRTISVNKSVEKIKNKYYVKNGAKTSAGVRTVDIPQNLADYLKSIKKASILVCPNTTGNMHTPSSFKSMWRSYLNALNREYGDFSNKPKSKYDPHGVPFTIPKINPHWLRHTYATLLYFSGVDIMTAKEQLGHASVQTTLSLYTHLDSKFKRHSMKKVDEYLSQFLF